MRLGRGGRETGMKVWRLEQRKRVSVQKLARPAASESGQQGCLDMCQLPASRSSEHVVLHLTRKFQVY